MQQTVSENFPSIFYSFLFEKKYGIDIDKIFYDTLDVSWMHFTGVYTFKVKFHKKGNNPQVTKAYYSLVGTSEAIRLLSINTQFSSLHVARVTEKNKKQGLNKNINE
jgi:hypothetical protein